MSQILLWEALEKCGDLTRNMGHQFSLLKDDLSKVEQDWTECSQALVRSLERQEERAAAKEKQRRRVVDELRRMDSILLDIRNLYVATPYNNGYDRNSEGLACLFMEFEHEEAVVYQPEPETYNLFHTIPEQVAERNIEVIPSHPPWNDTVLMSVEFSNFLQALHLWNNGKDIWPTGIGTISSLDDVFLCGTSIDFCCYEVKYQCIGGFGWPGNMGYGFSVLMGVLYGPKRSRVIGYGIEKKWCKAYQLFKVTIYLRMLQGMGLASDCMLCYWFISSLGKLAQWEKMEDLCTGSRDVPKWVCMLSHEEAVSKRMGRRMKSPATLEYTNVWVQSLGSKPIEMDIWSMIRQAKSANVIGALAKAHTCESGKEAGKYGNQGVNSKSLEKGKMINYVVRYSEMEGEFGLNLKAIQWYMGREYVTFGSSYIVEAYGIRQRHETELDKNYVLGCMVVSRLLVTQLYDGFGDVPKWGYQSKPLSTNELLNIRSLSKTGNSKVSAGCYETTPCYSVEDLENFYLAYECVLQEREMDDDQRCYSLRFAKMAGSKRGIVRKICLDPVAPTSSFRVIVKRLQWVLVTVELVDNHPYYSAQEFLALHEGVALEISKRMASVCMAKSVMVFDSCAQPEELTREFSVRCRVCVVGMVIGIFVQMKWDPGIISLQVHLCFCRTWLLPCVRLLGKLESRKGSCYSGDNLEVTVETEKEGRRTISETSRRHRIKDCSVLKSKSYGKAKEDFVPRNASQASQGGAELIQENSIGAKHVDSGSLRKTIEAIMDNTQMKSCDFEPNQETFNTLIEVLKDLEQHSEVMKMHEQLTMTCTCMFFDYKGEISPLMELLIVWEELAIDLATQGIIAKTRNAVLENSYSKVDGEIVAELKGGINERWWLLISQRPSTHRQYETETVGKMSRQNYPIKPFPSEYLEVYLLQGNQTLHEDATSLLAQVITDLRSSLFEEEGNVTNPRSVVQSAPFSLAMVSETVSLRIQMEWEH